MQKSCNSQVNRMVLKTKNIKVLIKICEDLVSYKGYSSGIALAVNLQIKVD